MTVKELKEKLAMMQDNMNVFVAERKTEFAYGLVNSAYVKEINFMEAPDGEAIYADKIVVLDEE